MLDASRRRLIIAREEDRRRIRRDLHDGLGPMLAAMTLKLDIARDQVRADPDGAEQRLLDLKTDAQTAVAEIRRLVRELRPPALDELGLVDAIRQRAAELGAASAAEGAGAGGSSVSIVVDSPRPLPPLGAAVEVAAYRIALDHPVVGGGFKPLTKDVYSFYTPEEELNDQQDAHSIYFQVMAEHGFVGLGLYLALILSTLITLRQVMRCYLLDSAGTQRGDNLDAPNYVRRRDFRYFPLGSAVGANWMHRHYFRRAMSSIGRSQISRPYLSLTDPQMCITLSRAVAKGTDLEVLCCDLEYPLARPS